jgi:hypothetical protein
MYESAALVKRELRVFMVTRVAPHVVVDLSIEGLESGEILAQRLPGGAGRPEGQNLGALVALCG